MENALCDLEERLEEVLEILDGERTLTSSNETLRQAIANLLGSVTAIQENMLSER